MCTNRISGLLCYSSGGYGRGVLRARETLGGMGVSLSAMRKTKINEPNRYRACLTSLRKIEKLKGRKLNQFYWHRNALLFVGITPELRQLTTLERARLQTFPQNFEFEGTKTNLEQLIGNAVPVDLAKYVGVSLKNSVSSEFQEVRAAAGI